MSSNIQFFYLNHNFNDHIIYCTLYYFISFSHVPNRCQNVLKMCQVCANGILYYYLRCLDVCCTFTNHINKLLFLILTKFSQLRKFIKIHFSHLITFALYECLKIKVFLKISLRKQFSTHELGVLEIFKS